MRRVIGPSLLAPRGPMVVTAGAELEIRWSLLDVLTPTHTDIYFSRTGSVTWEPVAAGVPGTQYLWRVPEVNTRHGRIHIDVHDNQGLLCSDAGEAFEVQIIPLAVGDLSSGPLAPALTNAPNPFIGVHGTSIRFALATAGPVDLEVFSAAGRRVRLLERGWYPVGWHESHWDGRDDRGMAASPGLFFARLRAAGAEITRRIVLLK